MTTHKSAINFPQGYPERKIECTGEINPLRPSDSESETISTLFDEGQRSLLQSELNHQIGRIIVTPYNDELYKQLHNLIEKTINKCNVIISENIRYIAMYQQELHNVLGSTNYQEYERILTTLAKEYKERTSVYRSHRLKKIYQQIIGDEFVREDNIVIKQWIENARSHKIQGIETDTIDSVETYIQDRQHRQY